MRKIQKVIITVYGLLVAVACIYVPWITMWSIEGAGIPMSSKYSLLWQPALMVDYMDTLQNNGVTVTTVIDFKRVILELIVITVVFAILFVLTLRPKKVLPGS